MTSRFAGEYVENRKELHNAVRASAGNRCVRCGHPEGDRMEVTADHDRCEELCNRTGAYARQVFAMGTECWRVFIPQPCTEHCTHEKGEKLRILTVHHLTGKKDDNRWWNLLALCQVCHLQVQGKVIPEVPYLWPHTAWFIPYACGFYAAYYGGIDITRAQADAEPDRFLAMGQPWLYQGIIL